MFLSQVYLGIQHYFFNEAHILDNSWAFPTAQMCGQHLHQTVTEMAY